MMQAPSVRGPAFQTPSLTVPKGGKAPGAPTSYTGLIIMLVALFVAAIATVLYFVLRR